MSEEAETPVRESRSRAKTPDYEEMSLPDLIALRDRLAGIVRDRTEAEKLAIIEEAKRKLAEIGVGPNALFPPQALPVQRKRSGEGGSVAVKFRGPNGETWTGRGRTPTWLAALEAEGQGRDQFKV